MATAVLLLGGFAVLIVGGELLVRGASRLAAAVGLSPLVIGLTVVALATSSPELAVTVQAVNTGNPELAVGNVVGSNIANVLLVLGVAAVIGTLVVKSQMVRVDVPVMVAMSIALLLLSLDGSLATVDCLLLLAGLVGYLTLSVVMGRRESARRPRTLAAERVQVVAAGESATAIGPAARDQSGGQGPAELTADGPGRPRAVQHLGNLGLVAAGVAALVVGAGWLVEGATRIATELGIPDVVIGLTVVAIGTSLPELTTTIIAAIRGERDLAIGNAVGSNIANMGAVLGIAGLLAPGGIPVPSSVLNFDLPVMVAVSFALLPIVYTGYAIRRWEGALFLGLYGAYMAYLLLNATDHERLPAFSAVMLWFVLPIVAISLGALAGYDAGLRRGRAEGRARDQMLSGGE